MSDEPHGLFDRVSTAWRFITKHYSRRRWIGPFVGVAASLALLHQVLPETASPIVYLVFGFILLVPAFVLQEAFFKTSRRKYLRTWGPWLAGFLLVVFCIVVLLVLSCVFIGKPVDLRKYISPDIVVRVNAPAEIELKPSFGLSYLRAKYTEPGSGFESQLDAKMGTLFKWIRNGTKKEGTVVVYESDVITSYYECVDGVLEFENTPYGYQLVEGVAFLVANDRYKQLQFFVDSNNNMADTPIDRAQSNAIFDLTIDSGDKLLVIVILLPQHDQPTATSSVDDHKAILLTSRGESVQQQVEAIRKRYGDED